MPRGFNPTLTQFAEKLHEMFIIVKAEGSVDECASDPVHVAVVYDESGYGPHTASLYVDQNRYHASQDSALEAASDMHTEYLLEHYPDDIDDLTERTDGMAWTMSAGEFVEALDSWSDDDLRRMEGVVVTRLEECEEPEEVEDPGYNVVDFGHPRTSSTRRRGAGLQRRAGGSSFYAEAEGKTAREAFRSAVEEAQYEHGHGGYSGTIAEKPNFVEFTLPEGMTIQEAENLAYDDSAHDDLPPELRSWARRIYKVFDDKWGPAVAIQLKPNRWAFFGMASS